MDQSAVSMSGTAPSVWRKAGGWAIVTAFALLLAIAVITLAASVVRGPDRILIPYAALAPAYFSRAGMSIHLFRLLRLATGCLTGLNLAGAAMLIFRQRRAHRRQPVAVLLGFAFLLLSLGMNGLLLLGLLTLLPLAYAVFSLGLACFALALMIFPDSRFVPPAIRWIALAQVVAASLAIAGALPPLVSEAGSVGFLLVALAGLLWRYRNLSAGTERQQIRWALLGFAGGAVLVGVFFADDIVLQRTDLHPVLWVGILSWQLLLVVPLMNLLITGGLVISLLKYRLYDADRIITRSVAFAALTLALLAIFAGSERAIELLGEEYFGHSIGALSGGIGAALAAVMLVPLHHRLSHWAEHRFQKELIRLKRGLPLLVGDMRETAPVSRIAAATLDSVVRGVRASRAALVIDGALVDARGIEPDEFADWRRGWHPAAGNGLDAARDDALFPLRVPLAADGHGRIGWLLLGPRPDGSFYGKDERETLAEIADPVARALEIAAAREKREADEARRWQAQESLNAEIRSVNGELVRVLGSLDARLTLLVPLPPAEAAE